MAGNSYLVPADLEAELDQMKAAVDGENENQEQAKADPFLMETLPEFTQRPWLETLPRGLRIYVARYMLSQHRMPIEVGRWTKQDRTERTCTHCRNTGRRCGQICRCVFPHKHKCVGSERHYLTYCPSTNTNFGTMAAESGRLPR